MLDNIKSIKLTMLYLYLHSCLHHYDGLASFDGLVYFFVFKYHNMYLSHSHRWLASIGLLLSFFSTDSEFRLSDKYMHTSLGSPQT